MGGGVGWDGDVVDGGGADGDAGRAWGGRVEAEGFVENGGEKGERGAVENGGVDVFVGMDGGDFGLAFGAEAGLDFWIEGEEVDCPEEAGGARVVARSRLDIDEEREEEIQTQQREK